MGDDAIGIITLEELRRISSRSDAVFITTQSSGIPLAEMLIGYDKAIIIDSIIKADGKYGELYHIKYKKGLEQNPESMHTIGIVNAIEVIEKHGAKMPDIIKIYAINIGSEQVVSDKISDELSRNISDYAREIANHEELIKVKREH